MRFLLDVNVGTTIAKAVAERGHDVVRVSLLTPRAKDCDILAQAVEDERILISYDSDFTDLIFRDGATPPFSIIFIRFQPNDVADLVAPILSLLGDESLKGHMIVIGPSEMRWRPFPRKTQDNA